MQVIQTPEQQMYLTRLIGYDYSVSIDLDNQMLLRTRYPAFRSPSPAP